MAKIGLRELKELPPNSTIWDEQQPGFIARRQRSNAITFAVYFRSPNEVSPSGRPKQRLFTIGRFGPLGPEQARKEARRILGEVAAGKDPQAQRQEQRDGASMGEMMTAYMAAARAGKVLDRQGKPKTASTLRGDQSRIDTHFTPKLGGRRVNSITRAEIANLELSPRTLGLLGGIFTWGIERGYLGDDPAKHINPVKGIRRKKDAVNERRLSADEYSQLGAHLRADTETSPFVLAALEFICLTGWRASEATTLQWSFLDLKNRIARLPHTKTGPSERALSSAALDLLRRVPRMGGNPFVFPAQKAGALITANMLVRVMDDAGLPTGSRSGGIACHTLRHSFASTGDDLDVTEAKLDALLGRAGHQYIHPSDEKLRAAADLIAAHISGLLKA